MEPHDSTGVPAPNSRPDDATLNLRGGVAGQSRADPSAFMAEELLGGEEASPAPVIAGSERYVMADELGRGGMGVVHRTYDTHLGRVVAAKVLREGHAGQSHLSERFLREARLTSRLQHPGIVPTYDLVHSHAGRPYFTMRLVEGDTLAHLLASRPGPDHDRPRFLKVFEQVCQTVGYAHSQGVIHRDLKPGNVMVGPFGSVQVMDWGLAKLVRGPADDGDHAPPQGAADQTLSGTIMGTPAYMPPEQAAGRVAELDERCDVFGLGAILCEILTGNPPYTGKDAASVLLHAAAADLAPAYARLDGCHADADLIALTRRCLAPDPVDRPPSAVVLAAEFTAYLEAALRQAERDLVRFFELSLDLFAIAGVDGYFRRVNPNFSRVLGFTAAELTSRPYLDFVHPEDRAVTEIVMSRLYEGLPVVQFRNRCRDSADDYRWFEWVAKSIPEEGIIFAVARDVTERIVMERRLRAAGGK